MRKKNSPTSPAWRGNFRIFSSKLPLQFSTSFLESGRFQKSKMLENRINPGFFYLSFGRTHHFWKENTKKSGIAFAVPDFFVSVQKDSATRCGCALRSACRGGLQPGGLRPGPTEAAAETSPSAPATKPAKTLGFRRFPFFMCCMAMWCNWGSDFGFPHRPHLLHPSPAPETHPVSPFSG